MTIQKIAVLCGDIHLSHDPPIARGENRHEWYSWQLSQIDQLKEIANDLPIVCSGDVFDKWNSPSELVNFAIRNLPEMWAVPGQHDLRNHSYADVTHTSYGTLLESGTIKNLHPGDTHKISKNLIAQGFPWGVPISPRNDSNDSANCIFLAVVHQYVWYRSSYPGANPDDNLENLRKRFRGFHGAVIGDNHRGTNLQLDGRSFFLNGTFMRRKSDEKSYKCQIGILYLDGSIKKRYLNPIDEQWRETTDEIVAAGIAKSGVAIAEFLTTIRELGDLALDFQEAIQAYLKTSKIPTAVKKAVLEIMEAAKV